MIDKDIIVKITHETDDPICHRVSLGGFRNQGLYCVYRFGPQGGKPQDIIEIIETVLVALKGAQDELQEPDAGGV